MTPSHIFAISSDNAFSVSKNSLKVGQLGSIFLVFKSLRKNVLPPGSQVYTVLSLMVGPCKTRLIWILEMPGIK